MSCQHTVNGLIEGGIVVESVVVLVELGTHHCLRCPGRWNSLICLRCSRRGKMATSSALWRHSELL